MPMRTPPIDVRDAGEIEHAVTAFAQGVKCWSDRLIEWILRSDIAN
jgi:hypothetical protein